MKWINKMNMRKIQVDGNSYLWKIGHFHLEEFEYSKCVEKVIIYCEGFKNSPLHLFFREEDNLLIQNDVERRKWCVGYPDTGVIWLYQIKENGELERPCPQFNLNRPAVIEKLIQHFLNNGWNPKVDKRALIVQDALNLLHGDLNLPEGINRKHD